MASYGWGCGSGYRKFWRVNCNFLAQRSEICSYVLIIGSSCRVLVRVTSVMYEWIFIGRFVSLCYLRRYRIESR